MGQFYQQFLRIDARRYIVNAVAEMREAAVLYRCVWDGQGIRTSVLNVLAEMTVSYSNNSSPRQSGPRPQVFHIMVRDMFPMSQTELNARCNDLRAFSRDRPALENFIQAVTFMLARSESSMPDADEAGRDSDQHDQDNDQVGASRTYVDLDDPDTVDELGNCRKESTLVVGRLAMRGKMVVQLPSLNPSFPDCFRRFIVRSADHHIWWGSLGQIAKLDRDKLIEVKRTALRPSLLAVTSSPYYTRDPQANPIHHLLLQLPSGAEWHNKSGTESLLGNYKVDMREYWEKSGQEAPIKPRPASERSHLQEIAVRDIGAAPPDRGSIEERGRRANRTGMDRGRRDIVPPGNRTY